MAPSYIFSVLCFWSWLLCTEQSSSDAVFMHSSAAAGDVMQSLNSLPEYFPAHLRPYVHMNASGELMVKTQNALAIRYGTPQGMHINVEVLGSVVLEGKPTSCAQLQRTGGREENKECFVNVLVVFDLPVGVFVDPYELKSRHEYEWENILVHTSAISLSHLSGEKFTKDASPFVLALELLAVPLSSWSFPVDQTGGDERREKSEERGREEEGINPVRGIYRVQLPLHLRYSSEFAPPTDINTETQSQCGPRRHNGHCLVSRIPLPHVFVGHHLDPRPPTASASTAGAWNPGVAFVSSSPSFSRSGGDGDNKKILSEQKLAGLQEQENIVPNFYLRGKGLLSEHSVPVQAMQEAHRRAHYALSQTLGVTAATTLQSSSFSHKEYKALLSGEVDFGHILNGISVLEGSRVGDNQMSHQPPLIYYEDKAQASCLYLPNSEGAMEVYVHMPVPNQKHVHFVVVTTCLIIFMTTALIAYALLIPPVIRDKQ